MVAKTIKILHAEEEIFDKKKDIITYCKCQVCGDNAVGKGYSNRFFRCQTYLKSSKNADDDDEDEDDIISFSICDLCIEKVYEKDILVFGGFEYVIDVILREEN